jgi:hypothetical protein
MMGLTSVDLCMAPKAISICLLDAKIVNPGSDVLKVETNDVLRSAIN